MLMVSDLLELARGTTVESGIRARSPARFADQPAAPIIVWNICRHCDMTCPHCYVAAGPKKSPTDLSTEQARAVIDDLAATGVRTVIVSGGEPLLRDDVFELLAYLREKGISAQLSTNGIHIDAAVAARLKALGVGYVGVSVDGTRAFNDAYRGIEGAFDRALAGLAHARDAGLKTGLRMTVTRRNLGQLTDVLAAAESVGASRFYVSHLVYAGRGRQLLSDDLSRVEARALLLELFALAERKLDERSALRIVTGSNDSDGPLLLRWVEGRHGAVAAQRVERLLRARGGNSAGERVLAIDHRGNVHPDQFWQQASLGTVPEQSLTAILAHPLRDALRMRSEHLLGRCGSCRFKDLCRGSHRERALAKGGDLWGPDPACVMDDDEIAEVPLLGVGT